MKFRLLGVVFFIGGLILDWFAVFEPLREAQAHAAMITYSWKSFAAVPVAIFIGLLLMAGGERVWLIVHGTPDNAKDWAYRFVLVGTGLGVGWATWTWFEAQMTALGYVPQP